MKKRSFKLTLPIYANVSKKKKVLIGLNWYRNAHYHQSNKVKDFIHQICEEQCAGIEPFDSGVVIKYDIYISRKGIDGGNVRSIIEKFGLDGLVSSGVITDDRYEFIKADSSEYHLDKDNPRAEITITQI